MQIKVAKEFRLIGVLGLIGLVSIRALEKECWTGSFLLFLIFKQRENCEMEKKNTGQIYTFLTHIDSFKIMYLSLKAWPSHQLYLNAKAFCI